MFYCKCCVECLNDFLFRNKLKKLDRKFCLVDKRNINGIATPNIDPRHEEGSFNDRRKRLTMSSEEELKYLKDDLDHLAVAWPGDFDVFWMDVINSVLTNLLFLKLLHANVFVL